VTEHEQYKEMLWRYADDLVRVQLPSLARWLDENYDVGSRGEPVRRRRAP
jgi:hypothetical protein